MQPRNSYLHRYPVWTILIATSVFAAPPTGHPPAVEPAVGAIAFGDQHVTAAEQQLVMRLHVAEIFQHYRRTAGSIDDRVFWDTPIGDERPIDRLRTLTLDDLRAAYAEAAVARKHGVLVPRFEEVIQPANSSPDHRGPVAGVGARVQDPTTLYLAARRRVQADVCRVIAAELSADEPR